MVDEKRAQTKKIQSIIVALSSKERRSCCCVFAFFAVPSSRNRHVRRKERTTKKVAGKPVSLSPGGTLGSGRGPSRCPSFKNSQASEESWVQSGVPCSAPRLTVCLLSPLGSVAWGPKSRSGRPEIHHAPSFLFSPSFRSFASLTRHRCTNFFFERIVKWWNEVDIYDRQTEIYLFSTLILYFAK